MSEREVGFGKGQWKELTSILESLPLESCTRECDPITQRWGWKAPKNKEFRISRQFSIITDSDRELLGCYPPQPSADLLKELFPKEYKRAIKDAHNDEDKTLELLAKYSDDKEMWGMAEAPPKFFDGKWLIMYPDFKQQVFDEKNRLEVPNLLVGGEIKAWSEREYSQEIKDINPKSSMITRVFFDSQILAQHWTQDRAETVLGKCKIELIDTIEKDEKEVELYTAEPKDAKNLYLPEGARGKGVYTVYDFMLDIRARIDKNTEDFAKSNGMSVKEVPNPSLLTVVRVNEVFLPENKIIVIKKAVAPEGKIIIPEKKKKNEEK